MGFQDLGKAKASLPKVQRIIVHLPAASVTGRPSRMQAARAPPLWGLTGCQPSGELLPLAGVVASRSAAGGVPQTGRASLSVLSSLGIGASKLTMGLCTLGPAHRRGLNVKKLRKGSVVREPRRGLLQTKPRFRGAVLQVYMTHMLCDSRTALGFPVRHRQVHSAFGAKCHQQAVA